MLRRSSPVQRSLVYATFFTISLMIHMVLVWPRRSKASASDTAPVASQSEAPTEGGP